MVGKLGIEALEPEVLMYLDPRRLPMEPPRLIRGVIPPAYSAVDNGEGSGDGYYFFDLYNFQ